MFSKKEYKYLKKHFNSLLHHKLSPYIQKNMFMRIFYLFQVVQEQQLFSIILIEMQVKSFKCPKHSNQNVAFFCTVNQWHFVPLCNQCIPPHTQNHPKNFKISIQSYLKVRQKCLSQNSQALSEYNKRLQKIDQYLSTTRQAEPLLLLEQCYKNCLSLIQQHFSKLRLQVNKKMQDTIKYQNELLSKLKQNIMADIHDIENSDSVESVEQWAQIVRRLYFKDGINPYVQEIDDILKDHEDRVYKRKDLVDLDLKKMEEGIKKILQNTANMAKEANTIIVEKVEEKKNINNKQAKKQPKIVIKPKICKNCNGQLQYLTQLKKHLYCPNCGGKQRNYTKKQ